MRAVLRFLHATLVHKYYVYQAGRRLGVPRWQLLVHDLSKFHPAEYKPYARFFYAKPGAGWLKAVVDKDQKPAMLRAWLRHMRKNPHHWQHWVIINGGSVVASRGTTVDVNPLDPLEMPPRYTVEMLADWMGAGRAYNGEYPKSLETWQWWQQNKGSLVLHPRTRRKLTEAIMYWFHPDSVPRDPKIDDEYVWMDPPPSEAAGSPKIKPLPIPWKRVTMIEAIEELKRQQRETDQAEGFPGQGRQGRP